MKIVGSQNKTKRISNILIPMHRTINKKMLNVDATSMIIPEIFVLNKLKIAPMSAKT